MYYVYVIECQNDKSWYIGYTSDLKRRIEDIKMVMAVVQLLKRKIGN